MMWAGTGGERQLHLQRLGPELTPSAAKEPKAATVKCLPDATTCLTPGGCRFTPRSQAPLCGSVPPPSSPAGPPGSPGLRALLAVTGKHHGWRGSGTGGSVLHTNLDPQPSWNAMWPRRYMRREWGAEKARVPARSSDTTHTAGLL